MRILHVIFTRDRGGAERYAADLASHQAKAGHQVRLLIRPQGGRASIRGMIWNPAVQVAEVGKFLQTWHIKKHLKHFAPDVIHCHLGRAAQTMGRLKTKNPKIATLHIDYKSKYYRAMDGVICINNGQKNKIDDFYGKIEVIHNWLPGENKRILNAKKAQKGAKKRKKTPFVIGSIGRLHPSKGFDLLIQAFKQVYAQNKQVQLVLIGSGAEAGVLKKEAAGHPAIRFLPFEPDIAPRYHTFDLYVSAARSEAFGLTLLEAMAAGCPIVATATAGAQTVLAGQPATLVPVGQVEALAAALAEALSQPPRRVQYDLKPFMAAPQVKKISRFYLDLQKEQAAGR